MDRCLRDYYTVRLPGDLVSPYTDNWLEEILQLAINEARERAYLHVIPCEWTAWLLSGDAYSFEVTVRVRRRRRARPPAAPPAPLPYRDLIRDRQEHPHESDLPADARRRPHRPWLPPRGDPAG